MAISKRRDGYRVRWYDLDGTERSRQYPSHREATAAASAIREAHRAKRDFDPDASTVVSGATVSEVWKAYLVARAVRCRPHTMRVEAHHLTLFTRFLGTKSTEPLMSSLSRPVLDEFLSWLMQSSTGRHGKPRLLASAAKVVQAAQRLWKWAEDSERWAGIPRPRAVELPRSIPSPVVAPTWAEMDACIAACKGWQRQLATWLRYTGLRAGESMLLLWSDVDMERGTVTVRGEISKTKIGRTVPLSAHVLDEIATWGVRDGYLIPTRRHRDTKHTRDPRARDIRRAWKRAGVREAVWRQRPEHAFRRGFKSGLLALGATPDAVDYLQGHALGGSRGRYIDGAALPLRETVAMVPRVGVAGNVVQIKRGG